MPVLFDLDGTLLDTAPDFAFVLNKLRSKINLAPLETAIIRPWISEGARAMVRHSFRLDNNHPDVTALCETFLQIYQNNICQFTQPFPGMMSLLAFLEQRRIPWGIVTNKPGYLTDKLLTELDLKNRAACVVAGDTTSHLKPHPAPLLHACEQLNVAPGQCIYIGDAATDIEAGKAAGMTTIAALFGYIKDIEAAKNWGAHHYVQTVSELEPWIAAWKQKDVNVEL